METNRKTEKEDPLAGLSMKDKVQYLEGLDRLQLDVEQELKNKEIEPVEAEEDLRSIERIRARLLKTKGADSSPAS